MADVRALTRSPQLFLDACVSPSPKLLGLLWTPKASVTSTAKAFNPSRPYTETDSQLAPQCRLHRRLGPLHAATSGGYAVPQEPSSSGAAEVSQTTSPAGKVEFSGALINVLNILSGVGLLSVPYALRKAGWAGLGVLWLLGFVTNYTG